MGNKTDILRDSMWDTIYGFYNAPFAVPELVRGAFEPQIPREEISDAIRWECERQGLNPEKVYWREVQDIFGGGQVYKVGEDEYLIDLTLPVKITTIRHELRHARKGHCDANPDRSINLQRRLGIFLHEPPTFLYSAFGPSYKPTPKK